MYLKHFRYISLLKSLGIARKLALQGHYLYSISVELIARAEFISDPLICLILWVR